jgi:uncharacterized membrane protein (UPF0136 family)
MIETKRFPVRVRQLIGVLLLCALSIGAWWFLRNRDEWSRGEALRGALLPLINRSDPDQSLVAGVILGNYHESRSNASRWSGVYWGFTFAAAALSALAGLVLKLESLIKNEGVKKDIAAVFAVSAALLITISTGGDFQRKWQANRIAAAELERAGYEFLERDGAAARSYLGIVGQILHRRNMAIVGDTEHGKATPDAATGGSSGKEQNPP